jgi:hypothetical protein
MSTFKIYAKALGVLVAIAIVGYATLWTYERLKVAEATYRWLVAPVAGSPDTRSRSDRLDELLSPKRPEASPAPGK